MRKIKIKPLFKPKKTKTIFSIMPKKRIVKPIKPMFNFKPKYKRTIAEKKLIRTKPWGDRDGDLIPNWADCKPFDRKRQGPKTPAERREFWEKYDTDPKFHKEIKTAMTKNLRRAEKELGPEDFRYSDDDEYAVDRYAGYKAAKEAEKEAEYETEDKEKEGGKNG